MQVKILAALAVLSLAACGEAPDDPELSPPGMCVSIADEDPPVFRPCDSVDYVAQTCTFRVLDTTQTRSLSFAMTEAACDEIGVQQ